MVCTRERIVSGPPTSPEACQTRRRTSTKTIGLFHVEAAGDTRSNTVEQEASVGFAFTYISSTVAVSFPPSSS